MCICMDQYISQLQVYLLNLGLVSLFRSSLPRVTLWECPARSGLRGVLKLI
jgi:hypothetical protein